MTQLTNATLGSLSIPVPTYDRSEVKTGIVHFGVGGYYHAVLAMYLDQLVAQLPALDWGICGVAVMPFRLGMREAMADQDSIYSLALNDPESGWPPLAIGLNVE